MLAVDKKFYLFKKKYIQMEFLWATAIKSIQASCMRESGLHLDIKRDFMIIMTKQQMGEH